MKLSNQLFSKTWCVALLAFISCALWGSAFSCVKTGYALLEIETSDWASQLRFGGFRFAVAGIMVILFGSISSKKILLPKKTDWTGIIVVSLFQTILQYFFYYIGLAHTTGVKASVLVGMNVFTAILIAAFLFKIEKMTMPKALGCIIGFLGLILVNLNGLHGISLNFLGDGFILICTIASGFSSVVMKKYSARTSPILLSGWQFFIGGIVLWGIGILGGGHSGHWSGKMILLLLYMAFISAAAYTLWATLLKHNPVSKVAVFGFLNPMCGVVISAIVLKEYSSINLSFAIALLLTCSGIIVVNLQKE